MPSDVKPMAIKLPQQDRERLQKLGEAKKRSAHWLAKEAISQFLDREEAARVLTHAADRQVAERAFEAASEIAGGGGRTATR